MHKFKRSLSVKYLLFTSCLIGLVVSVEGFPQWVWNRDAIDNQKSGFSGSTNDQFFVGQGQSYNSPQSASRDSEKRVPQQSVRVVNGQARLIPNAISAVSNSIQNLVSGSGGGGGSSGALGGLFGAVLQNIPQFATQAIGGLFGGNKPISLPAKDPGDVDVGNSYPAASTATGACKCVAVNTCFLPSKPSGSCEGGKIKCCSTSRTVFPDDDGNSGSSSSTKQTKNERTVTQREIRRGLLQSILKGSGSLVDDTLDLFLQPFLTQEDQQKIATKVLPDE